MKMFGGGGIKIQLTAKVREKSKTWRTDEGWSDQRVRVKQHKATETPRGQTEKKQQLHADELNPACLPVETVWSFRTEVLANNLHY